MSASGTELRATHRAGIDVLPGTTTSCLILTALTVLLAVFVDHPKVDPVLRPLYFALLFSFFYAIGERRPEIRSLPLRMVQAGFLVLTLGSTSSAVLRSVDLLRGSEIAASVLTAMERGACFLLGLTLISYGILLWIPVLLESHQVLGERYRKTRGELALSERARSRMEERMVEADRLHAVGELAAGIAHDLRNPLAIIKAASESLSSRARSPEEISEHTTVITRNIDKAERTISALLDLGKPREKTMRTVELNRVVSEVLALLSLESRRGAVEIARDEEPGLAVESDRKLLSHVLLNLLLNALQASPKGSRVRVVTRSVTVGAIDAAVVAIEDRGIGIRPEQRHKLFTPFFTTKPEGTGLGLLSCRRIVDELGGRIGLFPRRAGGVRAIVMLPREREQEVAG